jgi:WD40 repeat protein
LGFKIYHSPLAFIGTLLEIKADPHNEDQAGFLPLIAALSCSRSLPGSQDGPILSTSSGCCYRSGLIRISAALTFSPLRNQGYIMKRLLSFIALLCVSCSGTPIISVATAEVIQPSPIQAMASTTPQPTPTVLPTETQAPTATQLPTATPLPSSINAQNAIEVDKLGEISAASLRKVVFSPDGQIFATASGNTDDFGIKTWQSHGGTMLQSFTGFSGIVWDLAFSPNGEWIASASDDQNGQRLRIWKVADGSQLVALDGPPTTDSVVFSPDGTRLAAGGLNGWPNGVIWIYDTTTWKTVQVLTAPGQNVTAVVFSQDGSQLISSGTDGHVRVWSVSQWTAENFMSPGKQANRLALSPGGRLLASSFCSATNSTGCTKGGVAIWRTSDWTVLQKFDDIAESLAFSADGSLLISGSGSNDPLIRIRRTEDWAVVRTLPSEANSVTLSPDSRLLVSTSWDKISLWGLPKK